MYRNLMVKLGLLGVLHRLAALYSVKGIFILYTARDSTLEVQ